MGQETKVLGGRYELQTEIARGAIGTVWRARDLTTGEQVAVKVLLPEAGHDPDVVKSLLDEAQILAELNHPSIVRARDVVANGVPALVMDLVEGADVRRRIRTNGPLRSAEVAEIGAQTADALAAVHAAGILHGDIKPGNILMPKDGGPVKLGDFGVARRIQLPDTVTHATPEYVAPEVVAGIKPTPASDVYSLGMVLYEMACGRSPYRGGTVAEVIDRHATCEPVQPAGMPEELWDLVLRCVELEPGNRPSAEAVAGELRRMAPQFMGRPAAALLPEYASTYRPRLIDPSAPVSPAMPRSVSPAMPRSPASASPAGANPASASPVSAGPVWPAPTGSTPANAPGSDNGAAPTSVLSQFDKAQETATGGVPPKEVGTGSKAAFLAVAAALFLLIGIGVGLMIWAGTSQDRPAAKTPATSPTRKAPKPTPSDKPSTKPSPSKPADEPAATPPNQPAPTQPGDNNDHFADNDGTTGGGSGSGGRPGLGDPMPSMPH